MKYEFQVLDDPDVSTLNALGNNGFSIVGIVTFPVYHDGTVIRVFMQRDTTVPHIDINNPNIKDALEQIRDKQVWDGDRFLGYEVDNS